MEHAYIDNGFPVLLSGRFFADADGVQHPTTASKEHKLSVGLYEVVSDKIDIARKVVSWKLELDGDVVRKIPIYGPPTASSVIRERTRRLALGFDYDFGEARGVHRIGTTESDMNGWNEVTQWATAMLALDQPGESLTVVTDTGPTEVTAAEWQEVLVAATTYRQPIWQASFVLQAMDPIPLDFAADEYWP